MVEPAFGQVRIRVQSSGVCHTDALAPRSQLIVAGAGGNEPIEVDPVPLLFWYALDCVTNDRIFDRCGGHAFLQFPYKESVR